MQNDLVLEILKLVSLHCDGLFTWLYAHVVRPAYGADADAVD